ncbi:hypothetical protein I9W82_002372 [Candida metapsilosis]|uniref:RGS domain-containing protein n=1 Tax=Candida metapsilosis TaxID=273372 RepID=A0A8H7ZI86_9ASCO|nr:hypothetical protein I9W82_002372 [Candida metapsilosis]
MNYYQLNNNRIPSTAPNTPCTTTKQFNLPSSYTNDSPVITEEREQEIPCLHDLIHNSATPKTVAAATASPHGNITLQSFNNYLSSIHCQENLQFILELNKYLNTTYDSCINIDNNEQLTHWQSIYRKFLITESEYEVNLPSRLSSDLHFAQLPMESTIQHCKTYIINEILQNLYHEYLKTVTKNKCGLYRRRSVAMGSLPLSQSPQKQNHQPSPLRQHSSYIPKDNHNKTTNLCLDNNQQELNSSIISPSHVRPTIDTTTIIEQQCPLTPPYSPPPPQLQSQQKPPQTPVVSQYLQLPPSSSSSNSHTHQQQQPHSSSLSRHISFFGRNNKRRHSSNSNKATPTNTHKHHDHHSHDNNTSTHHHHHQNNKSHKHKSSPQMIDGYDYYSIPVADVGNDYSSILSSTSTTSSTASSSVPPTSRSRPASICSNVASDAISSSSSSSAKSSSSKLSAVATANDEASFAKEFQDTPASSRNNSSSSKSAPSSSGSYYKSMGSTSPGITMVTSPTTPSSAAGIHKIVDNSMSYFNKMKKFKFKRSSHECGDDYDE